MEHLIPAICYFLAALALFIAAALRSAPLMGIAGVCFLVAGGIYLRRWLIQRKKAPRKGHKEV